MAVKKITLSGEIGCEITPGNVREQIDAAAGADLDVHLASPGGYVSAGIEIYNLIRDYKRTYPAAQLSLTIKGDAMSMASYIAVNPAWDLVAAEDNAIFMIHNAWGGVVGDYRDMKKMAEVLDGVTGIIGKAYTAKTGKSEKEIRQMMDNETWYFGDEIKTAGFVDEIIKTENPKDKADALVHGHFKFSALSKKMREAEDHDDLERIAASIRTAHKPAEQIAGNNTHEPVGKTQEDSMTLSELLAQNPAAKIEHDAALAAATEAGIKQGKKIMQDVNAAAGKYLGPDSTYPAPIKSLAVDVLAGNKSVEALETTVSAFDAMIESQKSQAAQNESGAQGNTPGQQEPQDNDMMAQIKRDRAMLGMEA